MRNIFFDLYEYSQSRNNSNIVVCIENLITQWGEEAITNKNYNYKISNYNIILILIEIGNNKLSLPSSDRTFHMHFLKNQKTVFTIDIHAFFRKNHNYNGTF